jgi:hypothetical protein
MPRIMGPVPFDKWERKVRSELAKQLPASWIVVCSVCYCWQNDDGYTRDGQADFVVLAPGLGMAIVEVKGTRRVWIDEDGLWYKIKHNGQKSQLVEPPPEQACRNMYNLTDRVKACLGKDHFPGLFAWLVVYPNGDVYGKLDLYYASSVVARKNVHRLKGAIESVLTERGKRGLGGMFTGDVAAQAAKLLTNGHFIVRAVDTELEVEEDSKGIDELTRQQYAALRGAFELPNVSIVGPAGSGKTVLAIWKLLALLNENKSVIYVCYNTQLAGFLKFRYPDVADSIVSVDRFFLGLVNARHQNQADYYTDVLPNLVMGHVMDMEDEDKYDAIIVDEGQDFGESRRIALYFLLKEAGEDQQWLIFSDQKQNLFQVGKEDLIDAEVTFRLYHNCRNTRRLNAATNSVCHVKVQSMLGVPEGQYPKVDLCRTELMAQKAWDLVQNLSPEGGSVILSPFKLENSCMKNSPKGHGLKLTEDVHHLGLAGHVLFSTIRSFKGLEAGHVVLVHADKPGANRALTEEDIYVAFTRATSRLDIVTTGEAAKNWYQQALQELS